MVDDLSLAFRLTKNDIRCFYVCVSVYEIDEAGSVSSDVCMRDEGLWNGVLCVYDWVIDLKGGVFIYMCVRLCV